MIQKLVLFTKDSCYYCHMLKEKLDEWNIEYTIKHNQPLPGGHRTYPQLYYLGHDVQQGNSVNLTEDILWDRIRSYDWPGQDSGIEGGF